MGWDAQNLDNTTVGITITRVLIAGEKNDRVKTICWLKTHSFVHNAEIIYHPGMARDTNDGI